MESVNKVLEALSIVERYEEYLFNRAWARALTIIGTVLPMGTLISLNITLLTPRIGLDPEALLFIAHVLTLIFCWGLVVYTFAGAWRTINKQPEKAAHDSRHGPMIAFVWFASFMLSNFAPEPLRIISLLWASGGACLLTYIILKFTESHVQEKVVLTLGLLLLLASLPILTITDIILSQYATLVAFSVCFIIAGTMLHRLAAASLRNSTS
ncbi:MAG: hypothetical protein ACTSWA_02220 [Candidatus Thorarchaeota archaeon]